jgi:hypothetical protein
MSRFQALSVTRRPDHKKVKLEGIYTNTIEKVKAIPSEEEEYVVVCISSTWGRV